MSGPSAQSWRDRGCPGCPTTGTGSSPSMRTDVCGASMTSTPPAEELALYSASLDLLVIPASSTPTVHKADKDHDHTACQATVVQRRAALKPPKAG
jgi:hypothetical protein